MARLYDTGIFSANATNGSVGVGYKLYFYTTGTTTPKNTYPTRADAVAGTNANANPVVAAADGRWAPIWLTGGDYKVVLKDFDEVTLETRDPGDDNLESQLSASTGAELVNFLQVGTGAVARTLQSKGEDEATLSDFMTTAQKNDYRNQTRSLDLTTAFQAAADAVEGVGRNLVVNMPPGILNLTAPIVTDGPVKFRGHGDVGQGMTGDATVNNGTAIKFNHTGIGFNASGFGFECSNCAVYRPQSAAGGGWTPYASDYDFSLAVIDGKIDVLFWGSKKGVNITAGGRVDIRARGQFFDNAITVTSATDSIDIWAHLWPFWSTDSNVTAYMLANLKALILKRCDGGMLSRYFSIYHKTGISFEHDASGDTTNFKAGNVYLDTGGAGIIVDAATNGVSAQFGNVNHQGVSGTAGAGITLNGTNAQIDISNFSSSAASESAIRNADGTGNKLRIGGLYMTQWNLANGGHNGCVVQGSGNSVAIGLDASIGTAAAGATAPFGGTTKTQGVWKTIDTAGTTGVDGLISFAHGLGYAPQDATVRLVGSHNYLCNVISIDATNVNCVVYSAASTVNSTAVSGSMDVYY